MLVLVQWAQQTDEEMLGMSFCVTIYFISVLCRVMKACSTIVAAWMVVKGQNNLCPQV